MKTPLFLLLTLALLLFTGCGGGEKTEGEDARLEIAVIPKGTTHEFWKSIHAGAIKAAREFDVDIIWQGPQREDDRQMQIQVVQNFISRGVDAIVLAPLDARSLARPVEAAVNRDIPVIIIDSGLESEAQASFIATNNHLGGQLGARRMAELLDGQGKIIMMRFQEGSASTTARENGFLEGIKEYAPEIEILSDNQYTGVTIEKALQASQNILNRFDDVDGIFCPNESSVQGMLRALQTAGRAGQVKLIGFDANETLINAMRAGQIHGLTLQDPFEMGYQGVKTAVDAIRGTPFEAQVDTRVMMVTADNMDDAEAQELLNPDLSWLEK
jgi:ribose transport system substrate-binding protein